MKMQMRGNREGIALMLVIIVMMVAATVSAGAAVIGANSWMVTQHEERQSLLQAAADAGLEEARARVNGNRTLYPVSGYTMIENNVQVTDADGTPIQGIRRTTYVGPTGLTTGQYGVFGSVVSIAQDANGDRVIRRAEIVQESFAKYAYFTNNEGVIVFGGGDVLWGPVHSNDDITVHSTGAQFRGPVTTARTIVNPGYGQFFDLPAPGYTQNVPIIPMPTTAQLTTLQGIAATGGMAFTSSTAGLTDEATMRLHFVAHDLNGDGDDTDADEGFVRVYRCNTQNAACAAWVVANLPSGATTWRTSRNCGHYDPLNHGMSNNFFAANVHGTSGGDDWIDALTNNGTRRCFLGGADELKVGGVFNPATANDGTGTWQTWPGAVDPRLTSGPTARPDANYLFPLSRGYAPNYKGVIHVTGKVAISGKLRGKITLAATNNIIIADDMQYSVNVGAGSCTDIMGLFSGTDVVVAYNGPNGANRPDPAAGGPYYTWDETGDEFLDGVVLALNSFTAQDYNQGSTTAQPCQGNPVGRGCLFLNGGVIQTNRGAVGTASGFGYSKRYSYDACAFTDPPPYFPTTGRFAKTRVFEVDPTGFSIAAFYASLTP